MLPSLVLLSLSLLGRSPEEWETFASSFYMRLYLKLESTRKLDSACGQFGEDDLQHTKMKKVGKIKLIKQALNCAVGAGEVLNLVRHSNICTSRFI